LRPSRGCPYPARVLLRFPRRRSTPVPQLRAVPKLGGGVRWLTDLDPGDDDAYRAAVAPLVPEIEGSLGPEVLANRVRRGRSGWRLEPWGPARATWRERVSEAIRTAPPHAVFAVADVRDCYASIVPTTVMRTLGPVAAVVVSLLERLGDAGVRGLPVGPEPSALVSNAVLASVDRALRASNVRHLRWVDDVVLWGPRGNVLRALDAAHRSAEDLGLELHPAKTRVLDTCDELRSWTPS
jgi:hypothetical protein